jgi:hypothetical protein
MQHRRCLACSNFDWHPLQAHSAHAVFGTVMEPSIDLKYNLTYGDHSKQKALITSCSMPPYLQIAAVQAAALGNPLPNDTV